MISPFVTENHFMLFVKEKRVWQHSILQIT